FMLPCVRACAGAAGLDRTGDAGDGEASVPAALRSLLPVDDDVVRIGIAVDVALRIAEHETDEIVVPAGFLDRDGSGQRGALAVRSIVQNSGSAVQRLKGA